MSKSEIVLTILALIFGSWITIRYTVPLMVEWLESMCIDETTIEMEDEDDY